MFPDHVETKALQHLQVVYHGLSIRRGMKAVWPVSLVQSSKLENKIAVQERTCDSIDDPFGKSSESSVTFNFIRSHFNCNVIEIGAIRGP